LIVPSENAKEAAVVDGLDVYGFNHIKDIISFLEGNPFETESIDIQAEFNKQHHYGLDFSDVKGQQSINLKYNQVHAFPFQVLGFFALLIFTIMAITSHDFWLKNLGPKVWKSLHMGVYFAIQLPPCLLDDFGHWLCVDRNDSPCCRNKIDSSAAM
ncbi:MAG: ferric reductase-like transmembrane domain-containing protein, partial [Flavobacteriaceae bacterium]